MHSIKVAVGTSRNICAFVVSLLLLGSPAVASAAGGQTWGGGGRALRMAIYLDGVEDRRSALPKFRIDLHNAGPADLVLNVGVMLANGRRQHATAIVLTLTDAQGKSRQFDQRS
jgi:hypothetical protein